MIESINFFSLVPFTSGGRAARKYSQFHFSMRFPQKSLEPETKRKSMAETSPYSIFEMVAAHRSLVSHATRSRTRARLSVCAPKSGSKWLWSQQAGQHNQICKRAIGSISACSAFIFVSPCFSLPPSFPTFSNFCSLSSSFRTFIHLSIYLH